MEFRTRVEIPKADFDIPPCEAMLFVGSCLADRLGRRFREEKFRAVVNPFGVMYNPVSIGHTVQKLVTSGWQGATVPHIAVFTLGTNHVYVLKETGEVVDNCTKRPFALFREQELTIDECADELSRAVDLLTEASPDFRVILTVSPIRYAKYGFHGSALSKAVLLLAAAEVERRFPKRVSYFPAYELLNDELRDYRFYDSDMLHPSAQAVEYIWQRFGDVYFGKATRDFLAEWKPVKEALGHRPFHPESEEYREFMNKTRLKVAELSKKYPTFAL